MTSLGHGPAHERDILSFGWERQLCPGTYIAEVQMLNVIVGLLAKCRLERKLDQNRKPALPDLDNKFKELGAMVLPTDKILRATKLFLRSIHFLGNEETCASYINNIQIVDRADV
ncbi:hypothetical protein BDA99DRAFT_608679 [Phascolomyces articulosus]|uniref:Cytochrome P450 n=1 Tax=Phascolomyces articulosus TaxID=60185 RepID=A0AAD5K0J7_9FUNG|nr:hypothetical protein BDA99DRAFT_608679 [Phascolomyces articulosus]